MSNQKYYDANRETAKLIISEGMDQLEDCITASLDSKTDTIIDLMNAIKEARARMDGERNE